ncbi:MAG: exodeoxyribonuclease VII small subunit [Saprospiraceae bacterium]
MKNKSENTMTYQAASAELEQILLQLQRGEIPIDDLIKQAKRASELLNYCKQKLRATSEALDELFPDDINMTEVN